MKLAHSVILKLNVIRNVISVTREWFFPRVAHATVRVNSRSDKKSLYDAWTDGRAVEVSQVCDVEVAVDSSVSEVSLQCGTVYEKSRSGANWKPFPLAGLQNAFEWKHAGVKIDIGDAVGGLANILRGKQYEWRTPQWGGSAMNLHPSLVLLVYTASGLAPVTLSASSSYAVQIVLRSPDSALADIYWIVSDLDNKGVRTDVLSTRRPAFLPAETAQERSYRKSFVPKRFFRWKRICLTLLLGIGLVILILEKANVIMDFVANVGNILTMLKD